MNIVLKINDFFKGTSTIVLLRHDFLVELFYILVHGPIIFIGMQAVLLRLHGIILSSIA